MLLDSAIALLGSSGLAGQQAENAIRVADRGNFRIDDHDRTIRKIHGEVGALLDAGGRIADDVFEAVLRELIEHALHAVAGERILVASLRCSEDVQGFDPFVLDQGLLERAVPLDDIHEVIHDAPLAPHDQIEIAQSDVEVDDDNALTAPCESARYACRGSRLSDTPLT